MALVPVRLVKAAPVMVGLAVTLVKLNTSGVWLVFPAASLRQASTVYGPSAPSATGATGLEVENALYVALEQVSAVVDTTTPVVSDANDENTAFTLDDTFW